MADLKYGASTVADIKLGSSSVSKVYLGSTLVWAPTATELPFGRRFTVTSRGAAEKWNRP